MPAANNIYSDAAYGLVTAKGKAASTILVLSKCDLAARDDVGWHTTVVPRLLGKDAELKKHLFKSVVATKCRQQDRTSKDTIPLDKADEDERAWAVAQLKITDVTPAEREQLQSRMTVGEGRRSELTGAGGGHLLCCAGPRIAHQHGRDFSRP